MKGLRLFGQDLPDHQDIFGLFEGTLFTHGFNKTVMQGGKASIIGFSVLFSAKAELRF